MRDVYSAKVIDFPTEERLRQIAGEPRPSLQGRVQSILEKTGRFWRGLANDLINTSFDEDNVVKNRKTGAIILASALGVGGIFGGVAVADQIGQVGLPTTVCRFSPETHVYTTKPGDGYADAFLTIHGVDYGTCDQSALDDIGRLNPSLDINELLKPYTDVVVPDSVSVTIEH